MALVLTPLIGIPLVESGDDLAALLSHGLTATGITLVDQDILAVAQKVVSKAEGRLVDLGTVVPSAEAHKLAGEALKDPREVELILQESREVMRVRPGLIIVEHRLGFVCANAGIDRSNVGLSSESGQEPDWVLLLPENPEASARGIQDRLEKMTGVRLGVIVIDSHGRAWRQGTLGAAIGLAGVPGLVDLRGKSDLFGYQLRVTEVGAADELAAAASLVMGQAAEGTPAVHVRGFPYRLRDGSLDELLRPRDLDLFR